VPRPFRLPFAATALAAALASAPALPQGVPVYDNAANLRWALQLIDNAEDMLVQLQQIEHLIGGLRRMDAAFAAITGNRGFGTMLRNVGLDRYIPANALQTFEAVGTRGFDGMSADARALRGAGAANPCAALPAALRLGCQAGIARPYERAAILRSIKTQQDSRIAQLRGLLDAVSSTIDPAQREQLTLRLVGEHAAIAQAEGQAATMRAIADNEDRIAAARRREATLQNLNRPGGLTIRTDPSAP
jgi:type IV secretion system protein VirB5